MKNQKSIVSYLLYLPPLLLLTSGPVQAACEVVVDDPDGRFSEVKVTRTDSGFYRETGWHDSGNTWYYGGYLPREDMELRSFFVFDVSCIEGTILGGGLSVDSRYHSDNADLAVYTVESDVARLTANHQSTSSYAEGQAIFADLNDGVLLDSRPIGHLDNGREVGFDIDASVEALNLARVNDGLIAYGITVTNSNEGEYAFSGPGLFTFPYLYFLVGPTPAAIDVLPWDPNNQIDPSSTKPVAVAVHTTSIASGDAADVDALQIDPASLLFGLGPNYAPITQAPWVTDIDGDTDTDVVVSFAPGAAGIQCTEDPNGEIGSYAKVHLRGELYSGEEFFANDWIDPGVCETETCH
jgi:hypothetical protein